MCCEKIGWNETECSSLCWGKNHSTFKRHYQTPYIYIYIDIYI